MESANSFARWQPTPDPDRIVCGQHVRRAQGYWALARCGHHCFSDGRAAPSCNPSADHVFIFVVSCFYLCRFCMFRAAASDALAHAVFDCSAHTILRRRWARRSRHSAFSFLHKWFNTDDDVNTARDIINNIQYVYIVIVCSHAETFEMSRMS